MAPVMQSLKNLGKGFLHLLISALVFLFVVPIVASVITIVALDVFGLVSSPETDEPLVNPLSAAAGDVEEQERAQRVLGDAAVPSRVAFFTTAFVGFSGYWWYRRRLWPFGRED